MSWQPEAQSFIEQVAETFKTHIGKLNYTHQGIAKQCKAIAGDNKERYDACMSTLNNRTSAIVKDYSTQAKDLPVKIAECFKESAGDPEKMYKCKQDAKNEIRKVLEDSVRKF